MKNQSWKLVKNHKNKKKEETMQLNKVGEKTYYLENATNIGIYQINEKEVYLIDTGNDKDCGKKILKIIEEQNWQIKGIINTHSHADHIGGNAVIQSRTNCDILSSKLENSIINNPILEPTILYGNTPIKELQNKFLMAKPSKSKEIKDLEEGLEYIELKGHSPNMIGVKTSDEIYFLGDALLNEETILKYHFFYLTDVKELFLFRLIVKQQKISIF